MLHSTPVEEQNCCLPMHMSAVTQRAPGSGALQLRLPRAQQAPPQALQERHVGQVAQPAGARVGRGGSGLVVHVRHDVTVLVAQLLVGVVGVGPQPAGAAKQCEGVKDSLGLPPARKLGGCAGVVLKAVGSIPCACQAAWRCAACACMRWHGRGREAELGARART